MAKTGNAQGQPRIAPVRKVAIGGLSGAIATLLIFILNKFVLGADDQITGEIAGSVTTVITFIVSYLVPPSENESVIS
jgi:hypothetical protein